MMAVLIMVPKLCSMPSGFYVTSTSNLRPELWPALSAILHYQLGRVSGKSQALC
jgi:hypothetical protein